MDGFSGNDEEYIDSCTIVDAMYIYECIGEYCMDSERDLKQDAKRNANTLQGSKAVARQRTEPHTKWQGGKTSDIGRDDNGRGRGLCPRNILLPQLRVASPRGKVSIKSL